MRFTELPKAEMYSLTGFWLELTRDPSPEEPPKMSRGPRQLLGSMSALCRAF